MNLLQIAWRNIQQRALASTLTGVSMALGVLLVTATLIALGVIGDYFKRNTSLGYNLIVGPKGDRLQLVLNTVYHLSTPVENLSYDVYQDMLPADHWNARRDQSGNPQEGRFHKYVKSVVPYCLGDNYQGYRVVGTTSELFEHPYSQNPTPQHYTFAEGKSFRDTDPKEFFTAVVGAQVAWQAGLTLGSLVEPTHGVSDEGATHDPFRVVGILNWTGTPNDRAIFVNMEGFYLLEGHDKSGVSKMLSGRPKASPSQQSQSREADQPQPLPVEEREVTALLVRTDGLRASLLFPKVINDKTQAQAVSPIRQITTLLSTFVGPFQGLLLGLTSIIVLVSAVSILVSIYNSMNERKRDIAVMRALGARRQTVMSVILLESVMLSLTAGLIGWLGAHLFVWAIGDYLASWSGVNVGLFNFVSVASLIEQTSPVQVPPWLRYLPAELVLIPVLILLAVLVGYLPARHAYNTDVSEALRA